MTDLSVFNRFIKKHKQDRPKVVNNKVWSYTRVSSRKQKDNYSLGDQKEQNRLFAEKHGYQITETFGNTNESASSDFTRKEFNDLIARVRTTKDRPFGILVHIIDRFSRTGGSAVGILEQLVTECNVHLIEVSSGLSTITEEGKLAIFEKLLDARRDNFERLKHTIPGMVRFVQAGFYLGVVPRGFDHHGPRVKDFSKRAIEQKILINEEGKKLRLAWSWKIQYLKDFEIRNKLKALGMEISLQQLSNMWRNPFYCGIQTNSLVGKDSVQGNWEPLVSIEVWLKVQQVIATNHQGYKIKKNVPMRPLVGTLLCPICNKKLAGYEGKGNRTYYKCQKGHGVSINAVTSERQNKSTGAHELFISKLDEYILNPRFIGGFTHQMQKLIDSSTKTQNNEVVRYNRQLADLEKKRDTLQEKYYLENIPPKDIYEKLLHKIETEIAALNEKYKAPAVDVSNLGNNLQKAIEFSQNVSKYWKLSNLTGKQIIQEMVFPDGLLVDVKNRQYLTSKVNALFAAKAEYMRILEGQKKEIPIKNDEDSQVVAGRGFEPLAFGL